jgi:hypothetical protein
MSRVRRHAARVLSLSSPPSEWNRGSHCLFLLGGYGRLSGKDIATIACCKLCECSAAASNSRLLIMVPFLDTVSDVESQVLKLGMP